MKRLMMALAVVLFDAVCASAASEVVDGVTWTYSVLDGKASVCNDGKSPAIPSATTGALTIPATLGGCPVTRIWNHAFRDCSDLTLVTIPEGVTSIGNGAFWGCSGLTSVTIPMGVTSIGTCAFYGCSGLKSMTIPDGVANIGDWAFCNCSELTAVTIPSSVTSIEEHAFRACRGLTSVTIPEGVKRIGYEAFRACRGLTSVTIPSSVTSIGEGAFMDCRSLTSVTIPSSVTRIGNSVFYNCCGLTSVMIPVGVTSIGSCAFSYCSGLTSVTIPEGVKRIEEKAFSGCSGLTSVTIPSSVTSIRENAFSDCSGLTSVTIPTSVTNIVLKSVFGREGRLLPSTNGMTTVVFPAQGLLPRRTLGSRLARLAPTVSRDADSAEEKTARKVRAARRSQFSADSSSAEFDRERDTLFMDIVREAEICQTNLAEYATYPYWPDSMSVVSNFCEKEGCVVVDVGHHFGAWRQGCGKKAYVVTCNMEDSSRFVPCRFEGAEGFRLVSRGGAHTNVAYRGVGPICCYDAEGRFEEMYDSMDKLPGMQDCLAADLKRNHAEQDRWMAAHGFSDAGTGRDAERKLLEAARTNVIVRLGTLRTILSKFPQWKAGNRWYQVCDVRADLRGPFADGFYNPRPLLGGGLRSSLPEINTNDAVFVKMNKRFENLGRSQDQLIEEFVRVLTGLKFGSSTDTNGVLDLKFNLGSYETCTFDCDSDGGTINSVTLIAKFDSSCEMNMIYEKLDRGLSTLASAIGLDRDALMYEGLENGSGLRGLGNQDWVSVQSLSQRFTITRDKRLFPGWHEYVVTISNNRNNAPRPAWPLRRPFLNLRRPGK